MCNCVIIEKKIFSSHFSLLGLTKETKIKAKRRRRHILRTLLGGKYKICGRDPHWLGFLERQQEAT